MINYARESAWGPDRIREFLKFMGWNQRQLAEALGVGPSQPGTWLMRGRPGPQAEERLNALAKESRFDG